MSPYNVTGCCTARLIAGFNYEVLADAERDLKHQINRALLNRIVILHAWTTAAQTVGNQALKEAGFNLIMDAFDYKYPEESKRLYLWTLDLNTIKDKKVEVAPAVNPFQTPPQAQPVAIPARRATPRKPDGQFVGYGQEFVINPGDTVRPEYVTTACQYRRVSDSEMRWYHYHNLRDVMRAHITVPIVVRIVH